MSALCQTSHNPICAVELLAVLCAMRLWRGRLSHRASLCFVDNDPAKHALVRGGSAVFDVASIVQATCELEIAGRMLSYIERVPSSSNPADAPSRGE